MIKIHKISKPPYPTWLNFKNKGKKQGKKSNKKLPLLAVPDKCIDGACEAIDPDLNKKIRKCIRYENSCCKI